MKKNLIFGALFLTFFAFAGAADTGTQSKLVMQKKLDEPKKLYLYLDKKAGADAVLSLDKENLPESFQQVCKLEIKKRTSNPTQIQLMHFYGGRMMEGEKYRVEYLLKSSRPVEFSVNIIAQKPGQCRRVGKDASSTFSTAGNVWEKASMEFTVDDDFEKGFGFRIPNLNLGNLPEGTAIWIAEVKFWKL
ncbi:MAG: hypothetical protein PHS41_12635 [Victivallaceae bacterium]|nr:hypothetical protein [Victivallaceae bacterium]